MALADEHIFNAVVIVIHEGGAEAGEIQTQTGEPDPAADMIVPAAAAVAVQGMVLLNVIGDEQGEMAAAVVVGCVHAHAAVGLARFIGGHAPNHTGFDKATTALVQVKLIVIGVIGDVDVGPAILIQIEHNYAEALAWLQAGLTADVAESAVAVVEEELVQERIELAGRANIAGEAGPESRATRIVREGPVHVLGHNQIGVAVAVEVRESGAGAPVDAAFG